jgi:sulfoxide reductase heme-binding subunit YedZ
MASGRFGLIPRIKIVVWIAAFAPLLILIDRILLGGAYIGGPFVDDPVELIQHWTGRTALILLFVTLSVTPFRRFTGYNPLIRFRRQMGLFAFFYATLHVFSYFVFDHRLDFDSIIEDIIEHNWVLVGFTAWVLLIPMALTSTTGWIRRLGGKRWNRLHRLIYGVAILGVFHFLWLVKLELTLPLIYGGVLVLILAARIGVKQRAKKRPAPPPSASGGVGR